MISTQMLAALAAASLLGGAACGTTPSSSPANSVSASVPPSFDPQESDRLGAVRHLTYADSVVTLSNVEFAKPLNTAVVEALIWPAEGHPGVTVGGRIQFYAEDDMSREALGSWGVVLQASPSRPGVFLAQLAIHPDGHTVSPAWHQPAWTAMLKQAEEPYSHGYLASVLDRSHRDPTRPVGLMSPPAPHSDWAARPPERRYLDPDSAPAGELAKGVTGMLKIDMPADIKEAFRGGRPRAWLIRVMAKDTAVLYQAEVTVGAHEFPIHFLPGTLEVFLVSNDRPAVVHSLGTLPSPVALINGKPVRQGRGTGFSIRWKNGPTPAEDWVKNNPLQLG